ncbi:OTU domain-containing protein 5-A-like [Lytechinus pictus]|uniref:OTU domain-containing protein 5-A-like n=1 Tax=Lytechinus pictus TaxID=7653 RepID=UPI0030BA1C53
MTILPKKKVQQEKRGAESGENHQHHGHNSHHHHAHNLGHSVSHSSGESRGGARPKSRNSPPRWNANNQRDDRLSNHDARTSYDSQERRENSHGGHSSNKRARHRSSPQHEYNDFEYDHAGVAWTQNNSANSQAKIGGSSPSPREREQDEEADVVNSGDEHDDNTEDTENIEEIEERFARALKEKKGFIIKIMVPDGACLFRSVADQVYGDQDWHAIVRGHCMDYMTKNADYFSQFITEDFPTYIGRKRLDSCHGNHVEMQALSEMYNRNIEVYMYSTEPINTFHTLNKTDNDPIRVSYHRNVHYNSVVNPHKATVGVGLGMPSFVPGLADKTLMREAIHISEKSAIEQTMLQDKLLATDWEATNEAIEEQVARESFVQWLKDNEKRAQKKALPATATCSSAPPDSPPGWWGEANQTSGGGSKGSHHSGGKHPSGKHPSGKHPSSHHALSGHHSSGHLVTPHHQSGHLVSPHHPHHPSGRLSPRNRGSGSGSRPNSPERLEAARLRPLSPNSIRSRNAEKKAQQQQQQQQVVSKADRPTTSGHISNPASPQGAHARDTASPKAGPSGYNPSSKSTGTGGRMEDIPPEEFGISEWESEDAILASILAQSHQEYLDTLIRSTHKDTDSDS